MSRPRRLHPHRSCTLLHRCSRALQTGCKCHHRRCRQCSRLHTCSRARANCLHSRTRLGRCHLHRKRRIRRSPCKSRRPRSLHCCSCTPFHRCSPRLQIRRRCRRHRRRSSIHLRSRSPLPVRCLHSRKRLRQCRHRRKRHIRRFASTNRHRPLPSGCSCTQSRQCSRQAVACRCQS